MDNLQFQNLPEEQPKEPMEGDIFLSGSLVDQKELKNDGESITYYMITKVHTYPNGNMVEYKPVYDILVK